MHPHLLFELATAVALPSSCFVNTTLGDEPASFAVNVIVPSAADVISNVLAKSCFLQFTNYRI